METWRHESGQQIFAADAADSGGVFEQEVTEEREVGSELRVLCLLLLDEGCSEYWPP
jgi:hypothetical protein